MFALCLFGVGLLKRTERPLVLLERGFQEFRIAWGKVFWISCRIVCISVPIISSCELDVVAINGCGVVAATMFTVALNPFFRLGSISMKEFSSTARARAPSGLDGLLFRSSQLSCALWSPSMKLVSTILSSITGCPLDTILQVFVHHKGQLKWFGSVAVQQLSIFPWELLHFWYTLWKKLVLTDENPVAVLWWVGYENAMHFLWVLVENITVDYRWWLFAILRVLLWLWIVASSLQNFVRRRKFLALNMKAGLWKLHRWRPMLDLERQVTREWAIPKGRY